MGDTERLAPQRLGGPENGYEQLFGCLDTALGPAKLLALEGVDRDRDFCRHDHVWQIGDAPAAQLRPIAEVEILGKRVLLPAAGLLYAGTPPQAGSAVEVEQRAEFVAGPLFDDEVAVNAERLGLSEAGNVGVEMAPAGLDAADRGIVEGGNGSLQKVGRRHKIGVKHSEEFAACVSKSLAQGARFVAFAIGAPELDDIDSLLLVDCDAAGDDLAGIVGRVVQYLNLEPICGPVECGDGVYQAADDMEFIVDRELDGYGR